MRNDRFGIVSRECKTSEWASRLSLWHWWVERDLGGLADAESDSNRGFMWMTCVVAISNCVKNVMAMVPLDG